MLGILIAEDHIVVRMGMAVLIKDLYPDAIIVEADTFDEALAEIRNRPFDLLLLDIHLPGGDNMQMIEAVRMRRKDIPVLIFSSYEEEVYALRYIDSGADGFLSKKSSASEMKLAIQKVLNGEKYLSWKVQQQLLQQRAGTRMPKPEKISLSNRELEVMNLLVKGISPAEIKQRLGIGRSTISTYKAQILKKMGVSNIVELVEKTREAGLNSGEQ